ncbi:MAG TPA: GNAT family N-acetyltransferase [Rectinemataceae bacterium]|nr:GNAT family N-acetyltransferase [Rectinemataceae bacterium]
MLFRLRNLTVSDIPMVDPLLMAAYDRPYSYSGRLRRLLELEPEGWIAAEPDGEQGGMPAGMGGIVVMGKTGYVGLVATDPALQHRGVATLVMRRLLEIAASRACERVFLDASDAGKPLYEKLGFVAEDGVGHWVRKPRDEGGRDAATTGSRVYPLAEEGPSQARALGDLLSDICRLDRSCWGDNRDRVLAAYISDDPASALVARGPEGEARGYAILQREAAHLGPMVALDGASASVLLGRVLAIAGAVTLNAYIPEANLEAARLFGAEGFERTRALTHMRLGSPLDTRRRRLVYSQANFALG